MLRRALVEQGQAVLTTIGFGSFFRVGRVGVRDSAGFRAPAVTAATTAVWSVSPRLIWLVVSAATRRPTDVTSAEDGR